MTLTLSITTRNRSEMIDITSKIEEELKKSGLKDGACFLFVPHTTAGITINENADPSVIKDISNYLGKLIPHEGGLGYTFKHREGNSDAHIKCSLIGHSVELLIHENRLMLGTWQGIMFAEFDGPRNRRIYVQIQGQ